MSSLRETKTNPITTTADDYCQVRHGPLHMRFPADTDTAMRLNNVINSEPVKWVIDGCKKTPRWRRVLQWLKGK